MVSGCRWPEGGTRPGSVTSTASAGAASASAASANCGPPRLDRLLQLVRVAADAPFLLGRRRRDQLHPRGDDAVLAAEEAVAQRLRVAGGLRLGELGLELGDELCDGSELGEQIGH